mmetsp:Transcript_1916/g.3668  ORF Transcript_1916/g.3668 Transcript_1916/m.3668 type:complete len:221 (+) Transcript_1916:50-712(+)
MPISSTVESTIISTRAMRLLSWIWALHVAVSLAALVPPYSMGSTMYAAAEPTDNSDTPPSSAVHVSYKLESNHPHERICLGDHTTQDDSSSISSGNNGSSFTCTTRAEQISREQERQDPYHWGVDQRIDGSNTEKELIRDVISMMQQYFMDEVLVKPAYKDVRHNCKNQYDLCAFWAALGECETNRQFMVPHCAAACRLCLLRHSGVGERSHEQTLPPRS